MGGTEKWVKKLGTIHTEGGSWDRELEAQTEVPAWQGRRQDRDVRALDFVYQPTAGSRCAAQSHRAWRGQVHAQCGE